MSIAFTTGGDEVQLRLLYRSHHVLCAMLADTVREADS